MHNVYRTGDDFHNHVTSMKDKTSEFLLNIELYSLGKKYFLYSQNQTLKLPLFTTQ